VKVVLFCGGQGMRIRDYSDQIPKPMVPVGDRPVVWHVMKYYAHYGHKEFILCLGYKSAVIKNFFLQYQAAESSDFRLKAGEPPEVFTSDIEDWDITFVDTGIHTEIGERLRRVKEYVDDDEMFLANYADGLTDLDLARHVDEFKASDAVASMMAIKPPQTYHRLLIGDNAKLEGVEPMARSDIWLNGGYFAFRREIFDYIRPGEDLVEGALRRLGEEGRVTVRKMTGFFAPMDTFKDKKQLDERYESGDAPWVVWKGHGW
jgi:glucose-1-phosphate cytidylyltransferase